MSRLRALGLATAVALPVAVVYAAGGLAGPFEFDDRTAIVENPSLRPGASLAELLWPPADTSASGRPIVNLSFALSRAVCGGLDPACFRAGNLALHVACALLVLAILRRTFARLSGGAARSADGLALAGALVFGLHPLASETVLYASQRTELWMALFYLATLYAAIRGASTGDPRPWHAAAVASCAAGMLCKESMVTAPIAVLLYDRTFLAGTFRGALAARKRLYAGLCATWLVLAAVMLAAPRAQSVGFHLGRSVAGYALAQCEMVARYLALFLWPRELVFDYGPMMPIAFADVWPQAILLAVLALGVLIALVRRPELGFAGAWVLLILAPTSSVVPIVTEIGAERRMYLPSAALCGALAWGAGRLLGRFVRGGAGTAAGAALAGAAALLLSLALAARAGEYEESLAIWSTVVERRPSNPRGHYNLGCALAAAGRPQDALAEYREAVRIKPGYGEAHDNLGSTLASLGHLEEALVHARRAVELLPGDPHPLNNLALTLYALGRPALAAERAEQALALRPEYADARNSYALALAALGRADQAEAQYREALRIDPDHREARYNLAAACLERGRPAEALDLFLRLVAEAPEDAEARAQAAAAAEAAGRADLARELRAKGDVELDDGL